jgi:hypothetical protein
VGGVALCSEGAGRCRRHGIPYCRGVELSSGYAHSIPQHVLARYDWAETRNASQVLQASCREEFDDLLAVLAGFSVHVDDDLAGKGGNETKAAGRLNSAFRALGWREGNFAILYSSRTKLLPWAPAGETGATVHESAGETSSFLIDNLKGRVAIDVEWHAKEGHLDRDLAAYRSLYQEDVIAAAVIVTVHRSALRAWALELDGFSTKFQTSTTTSIEKVIPKLKRGDAGGCPVLVAAVGRQTT